MAHLGFNLSEKLKDAIKLRATLDRLPIGRWIIDALEMKLGERLEPPPKPRGKPIRKAQSEAMKKVWARKRAEEAAKENGGVPAAPLGEVHDQDDPADVLEMLAMQNGVAGGAEDTGLGVQVAEDSGGDERKNVRRCPECRTELQPWLGKLRCMKCRENYDH